MQRFKKVIATKTDMRKVEKMRSMFQGCVNLEELSDTSSWKLENVRTLRGLFYNCKKLRAIPGINNWNPTKLEAKGCYEMFYGCGQSLMKKHISQVMEWEVDYKIKCQCLKGFENQNILDFIKYCLNENFGETISNFDKFLKKH